MNWTMLNDGFKWCAFSLSCSRIVSMVFLFKNCLLMRDALCSVLTATEHATSLFLLFFSFLSWTNVCVSFFLSHSSLQFDSHLFSHLYTKDLEPFFCFEMFSIFFFIIDRFIRLHYVFFGSFFLALNEFIHSPRAFIYTFVLVMHNEMANMIALIYFFFVWGKKYWM